SYIFLLGRCRHCRTRISIVYTLVELITGGLFLLMYFRFGLTLDFVRGCLIVALLIPVSWIDARWYIIPNAIITTGLTLGSGIIVAIAVEQQDWFLILEHLFGAVAGGGILLLIGVLGRAILRKEAMGGGDVKLMALIGLFLGAWPHLLIVVVLSAFIGSIVGLMLILFTERNRQQPIPYGPFLAIAAVFDVFWGEQIWKGYLRFIGWV
ncbi:MAG: A24 family peptidase, partial [Candidatus Poribacteria bacterium]|nr:A24 family peptidase [Candidatus Poribacteria bacterium]